MNKDRTLLGVIHYPMSIMEIYISIDATLIYEVHAQLNYYGRPHHIWKEYAYPINEYISRRNVITSIGKKIESIQEAHQLITSNGHEYAL
jgi:hypothetical protein